MGTEDWVLKGTKFNNKYQKAKIRNLEQRLDLQRYNIKETIQSHKNYNIYIYMKFALKTQSFFCKVVVGYKNEN